MKQTKALMHGAWSFYENLNLILFCLGALSQSLRVLLVIYVRVQMQWISGTKDKFAQS